MQFEIPYVIEKDEPTAAIIWLHGLGADGYDFAPIVPELNLDTSVRFIFPHAPIRPVTINRGMPCRSWFDIRSFSRMENDEDIDGMNQTEAYIHSLIQEQMDAGITSKRIILIGFSQGGAMAMYTALRYPKPLGGLVGLSTVLAGAHVLDATRAAENQTMPIFLAHGTYDDILPLAFATHACDWFRERAYDVEFHEYAMAHTVQDDEIIQLSHFLNQLIQCL